MLRYAVAFALLAALAGTASESRSKQTVIDRHVLPPKEFDHEFTGELKIMRGTQEKVKEWCARPNWQPPYVACSSHSQFTLGKFCWIMMLETAEIEKLGFTDDIVIRHELAHCGGGPHGESWPSDHPNARTPEEYARDHAHSPRPKNPSTDSH